MAGEKEGLPAAQPGEIAGSQTPDIGAPAPKEARTSEQTSDTAPASGFGSPKDHRVPYDRFKEVNSKRKEAEAKAAELQQQLELVRAQPQQPAGDLANQIDRLTEAARDSYNDPDRFVDAMTKIAQLSAQGTANSTLEGLLQQQQQQYQQQQFQGIQEQSWGQAVTEFPELNDQSSGLFKEAASEYESDPGLQASPTGMYRAVQAAALRRMQRGGQGSQRPTRLETGAPAPQVPADSDIKEDLGSLQRGGQRKDFRDFLAKHQPWTKSGG